MAIRCRSRVGNRLSHGADTHLVTAPTARRPSISLRSLSAYIANGLAAAYSLYMKSSLKNKASQARWKLELIHY